MQQWIGIFLLSFALGLWGCSQRGQAPPGAKEFAHLVAADAAIAGQGDKREDWELREMGRSLSELSDSLAVFRRAPAKSAVSPEVEPLGSLVLARQKRLDELKSATTLAQKKTAALEYFASFEFQKLKTFAARDNREKMLRQALEVFFEQFDPMVSAYVAASEGARKRSFLKTPLRAPGQVAELDHLYALALTIHHIDDEQISRATRDGFEPTSLYHMIREVLQGESELSPRTQEVVKNHRDQALLIFQLRYALGALLALNSVYDFQNSGFKSAKAMIASWAPDYALLAGEREIETTVLALFMALEARQFLRTQEMSAQEVLILDLWVTRVTLLGLLKQLKLSEYEFDLSDRREQSLYRLSRVLEVLRGPAVNIPVADEALSVLRQLRDQKLKKIDARLTEIEDEPLTWWQAQIRSLLNFLNL